ncbi:uncharacterized protein METZ01_LOCUS133625, partial [marine metagenome]
MDIKGSVFGDDSTVLIDAVSNKINLDGTVKGNIIPDTNVTYDIGSSSYRFKDLWLSGTTIHIGSSTMSVDNTGNFQFSGGIKSNNPIVGDDSTLLVDTANSSIPYAVLSGTPTTVSGYGITDALALGTSATTALAGDTTFSFASITSTPTTLAGYGITDGGSGTYSGTSDGITEGSVNLYFTDVRADARITNAGSANWNTAYGWGDHSGAGYLTSTGVLSSHTDVHTTAATDGQVLKWDNGNTRWAPADDTDTDTIYTSFDSDFDTRIGTKSTTDLSEGTNLYYTDVRADARIALTGLTTLTDVDAVVAGDDGKILYYDHGTTSFKWKADATGGGGPADTDALEEGSTNLYYTDVRADARADLKITALQTAGFNGDVSGSVFGDDSTVLVDGVNNSIPFNVLSGTPTTLSGYGITDGYANSDVDSHLNQSNPTSGYVLSWNGSDYSWVAQSGGGGGATDKIEEGDSSVEVIDGGANGHIMFETQNTNRWQVTNDGHILPEANDTYDIGAADKKVRDLYLGSNSLYIDTNTIHTSGTNLLFNDEDIMDYANLKNKPTIPSQNTGGTGIQVNSGVVSLNANLSDLLNVHTTAPTDGQVLKWDNSNSRWEPGAAGGTLAMNDLTDVDTSGISTGQYLQWNGSAFVASTVSGGGASAIDDLSDVDTTTSAPNNGDVLTWV